MGFWDVCEADDVASGGDASGGEGGEWDGELFLGLELARHQLWYGGLGTCFSFCSRDGVWSPWYTFSGATIHTILSFYYTMLFISIIVFPSSHCVRLVGNLTSE